jgi:LysM domain
VNRRIGQPVLMGLWFFSGCRPSASAESPLVSPLISPFVLPTPSSISPTPISMGAVVHVIQPGDTIQSLALQYHVPVEQIYYLNDLTPDAILRIGQQLIISDPTRIYTPPPTITPYPTFIPTPLPTIIPPIQSVTADHLPQISRDLLFINNGRLELWNHLTGQIEVLVGPETSSVLSLVQPVALMAGPGAPAGSVNGFSASNDGTKIALHRVITFTTYEIAFFDLGTRQLTPVYQGGSQGSNLLGMSISPDGQWIAYIPQDSSSSQDHRKPLGLAAPALYPSAGGGVRSGTVYVVRTGKLDQPMSIGVCGTATTKEYDWGCDGLLWAPDSHSIAWSDGRGIWLAQLGHEARQLTTNSLSMPNDEGQGVYYARTWSPSGRFILMSIGHWEGSSQGILDTITRHVLVIPRSGEYVIPGPRLAWMNDDRLFVVWPKPEGAIEATSAAEIWHIDSANVTLIRDSSIPLSIQRDNFPMAPMQLEDGRVVFAVLNMDNANYLDRGLYVFDPNDLSIQKTNGLPPFGGATFGIEISWSPDGAGAVVHDLDSGQLLFVLTDGTPLYNLQSAITGYACCFAWIK